MEPSIAHGKNEENFVVIITSVDTGKILDVDYVIKYCLGCFMSKYYATHKQKCKQNYTDPSGGMKLAGVSAIFAKSAEKEVCVT